MKRGSTIHLRGKDASNFMKAVATSSEAEDQGKRHDLFLMDVIAEREKLLAQVKKLQVVGDAAYEVMRHFADARFDEKVFFKMIDAMEPLGLALVDAGYGGDAEDCESYTHKNNEGEQ